MPDKETLPFLRGNIRPDWRHISRLPPFTHRRLLGRGRSIFKIYGWEECIVWNTFSAALGMNIRIQLCQKTVQINIIRFFAVSVFREARKASKSSERLPSAIKNLLRIIDCMVDIQYYIMQILEIQPVFAHFLSNHAPHEEATLDRRLSERVLNISERRPCTASGCQHRRRASIGAWVPWRLPGTESAFCRLHRRRGH